MSTLRLLIADDHPVFRFGMRALLNAQPDMDVVGEATTGLQVIALAAEFQPDVVLMDVNMPELNGVIATERIRASQPHTAILIVSMLEDDSVFAALRAGARGYLLKGAEPAETLSAIRAVARGEAIFSPGIAERLLLFFAAHRRPTTVRLTSDTAFLDLTDREREVLTLIAQGLTNSVIAERLVLRPKTVRNYITDIFSKLEVNSRAEAIIRARDAGFV